jgi:hypothetical protein
MMRIPAVHVSVLVSLVTLNSACGSASKLNAERDVLQREAEAISTRHQALDDQIATWSESVGAWAKQSAPDVDAARLVLSLTSRSYFLHTAHQPATGDTDAAYIRLETEMKDIQDKRSRIETEWKDLIRRDRAWFDRAGQKPREQQVSFTYGVGDPTVPIPGVAARQRCCSLTAKIPGETNCKLIDEFCAKDAKGTWKRVCVYICSVVAIDTASARPRPEITAPVFAAPLTPLDWPQSPRHSPGR